jgi:hypothetical protein
MPVRIIIAAVAAVAVLCAPSVAHGDDAPPAPVTPQLFVTLPPHVVLDSGPGTLNAPDGSQYYVPMGSHILDGTSWKRVDDEVRRLQDLETRLSAENRALREDSTWSLGWRSVALATVVGFLGGVYVTYRISQ